MTHTQREISKIFESLEFSAVFVGEENTFFFPLLPYILHCVSLSKDRLTGDKQTQLLNVGFFVTREPSRGNEDVKKRLSLSVLMLGLMESRKSWESMIGHKPPSWVEWTGERLARTAPSRCTWASLVFREDTPFLGCRESRKSFLPPSFLKFLQKWNRQHSKMLYFRGSVSCLSLWRLLTYSRMTDMEEGRKVLFTEQLCVTHSINSISFIPSAKLWGRFYLSRFGNKKTEAERR